mmetsp:Transcript_23013/g.54618  ORF Transcript_23013/g.54618 Transcript_23013/m.54618 type:complete len:277 (-) Transcript_23013:398-1228(-)|eukprot:CAMPEP_0113516514 /NCGR_PEP_ID=MMETSP0014_2-20120614/41625_1 /TAXON_ID=2857 /ORGANISM="Nitzschia sp." /LENGTH=276 /DNA_ID=CAMNT_0000413367 /DNA_START=188 /DNA_END=1018 /DNA_ORIENTATION=- /assembly_acc=CAM_ASM_000159
MNILCLLAAVLFIVGNSLHIAFYVKEYQRSHFDPTLYKNLDPDYLKQEWEFREEHRPKFLAGGIINALAWFFLMFPLIQLAYVLSQRGTSRIALHMAVAILAVTGCLTEWIARFLYIGVSMAAELIATDFNLTNWLSANSGDDIGWRALEVTHIVTYGLVGFIDAFEWLVLATILVLVHISVRRWRNTVDGTTFGAAWNALGLFIALFCILDFVAEVLRLDGFRQFGKVAFWYSAVNRLILIPMWLIVLALKLPYASVKMNRAATSGSASATGTAA